MRLTCTLVLTVSVQPQAAGHAGLKTLHVLKAGCIRPVCARHHLSVPPCVLQVNQRPALRPLVLVVKSLLKASGLNDVSTGGLGSFALANMVVAHLQEEQKVCTLGTPFRVASCGGDHVLTDPQSSAARRTDAARPSATVWQDIPSQQLGQTDIDMTLRWTAKQTIAECGASTHLHTALLLCLYKAVRISRCIERSMCTAYSSATAQTTLGRCC